MISRGSAVGMTLQYQFWRGEVRSCNSLFWVINYTPLCWLLSDRSKTGKSVVEWSWGSLTPAPQPTNKEAHLHAPEPNSTKS